MKIFSQMGLICALVLSGCHDRNSKSINDISSSKCSVELVVLGIGQDAGAPQIGNPDDPAWKDPNKRLYATSLGLLDHENGKRYLFEATPDIREQMQIMDGLLPYDGEGPYIDGIFLTHAHIGHYAGLMFLGRESMGAQGVPVYAMPRMKIYLETNGPWSQLVELGNIKLQPVYPEDADSITFDNTFAVMAETVPHRDEYSETAAYSLIGPDKTAYFVPDIDQWELPPSSFTSRIDDYFPYKLEQYDYAFLDATFFDDNELPGRDMSQIPHPRVTVSMNFIEFSDDEDIKEKVRFIHINHTNPLRDQNSDAYRDMTKRGFSLAQRGERFCLSAPEE